MQDPPAGSEAPLAPVLEQNIRTFVERRQRERDKAGTHERIAERVARFVGSMTFIYLHLLVYGSWILINAEVIRLVPPWDKSFVLLAIIAGVESIFLSAFVLITQNRMSALAERHADLDLQVSLLAEHEITQLITLVNKVAQKLGVSESADLAELEKKVSPEQVLDRIDEHEERIKEGGS